MDLDGVISPVPSQTQKARIRENGPPRGFRTWPGAIYDMYVDDRLLDWAEQLDHAYDVVWSSAWGETLRPVVATPLGLDHWPILSIPRASDDSPQDTSGPLGLKAQAIAEHLAQDPRPFAWCDDFLTRDSHPQSTLRTLGLPHLFIRPGSRTGLTPKHIEKLLEFANEHTQQQSVRHAPNQRPGSTRPAPHLASRRPSSVLEAVGGIALSGRTDQSPRRPIETSKGAVGGWLAGTVPLPLAGTNRSH
jgi:hypothetical protein